MIRQTATDLRAFLTGSTETIHKQPPPVVSRVALIQRYRFMHYISFKFPDATRKIIPVNVGQGQEYVEYLGENQYRIWYLNKHGRPQDYIYP